MDTPTYVERLAIAAYGDDPLNRYSEGDSGQTTTADKVADYLTQENPFPDGTAVLAVADREQDVWVTGTIEKRTASYEWSITDSTGDWIGWRDQTEIRPATEQDTP